MVHLHPDLGDLHGRGDDDLARACTIKLKVTILVKFLVLVANRHVWGEETGKVRNVGRSLEQEGLQE